MQSTVSSGVVPPWRRQSLEAISAMVSPDFSGPSRGWWPMENVRVSGQVGKLVKHGEKTSEVVFGGHYSPAELRTVSTADMEKIHDAYNRALRGDTISPPAPVMIPRIKSVPVTLSQAREITRFDAEGYDTSGEWVVLDVVSEAQVRSFTVRPNGRVARRFKLEPGSYEFRKKE